MTDNIELIGPNDIDLVGTPQVVSSPTEVHYAALVVATTTSTGCCSAAVCHPA